MTEAAETETTTATEEAASEPAPNLSTIPEGTDPSNIVKPVALAKELDIRPQIVYGWIRNMKLNTYNDEKGNKVILRSEFDEWQKAKEERKAARAAKAAEAAEKDKAKAATADESPADSEDSSDEDEDYE